MRIAGGVVVLFMGAVIACKGEPGPTVAPTGSGSAPAVASNAPVRAPREGAGTIACGKGTCRVGAEKCCYGTGECEPANAGPMPEMCSSGGAYRCDGREDCADGEVCCQEWLASGSEAFTTRCSKAPCMFHEACRGGGCGPGFTCTAPEPPNTLGSCVRAAPHARCGTAACSGATPVCDWDIKRQTGRCVSEKEAEHAEEHHEMFRCTSKAECGGESCCLSLQGGYCFGTCINAGILCATIADCPKEFEGSHLTGCDADKDAPWVKTCSYAH